MENEIVALPEFVDEITCKCCGSAHIIKYGKQTISRSTNVKFVRESLFQIRDSNGCGLIIKSLLQLSICTSKAYL
jgi:hypothetical protein